MKKCFFIIMILIISLFNLYPLSFADNTESDFQIYSSGSVLIDSKTGKILLQKDMNKQLYPASTTKILTAIISKR